jgi:hypothetical protein
MMMRNFHWAPPYGTNRVADFINAYINKFNTTMEVQCWWEGSWLNVRGSSLNVTIINLVQGIAGGDKQYIVEWKDANNNRQKQGTLLVSPKGDIDNFVNFK